MIDHATQPGKRLSASNADAIGKLSMLALEVRCDLLKRYAKQAGMAGSGELGYIDCMRTEPLPMLRNRYFTKPSPESGGEQARSVQLWQCTVKASKAALLDRALDPCGCIALSDLYAAEMYAPLLGVIADPETHADAVMDEAFATLSMRRWLDFLHAVVTLKRVCPRIAAAYKTLVSDFDCTYPTPRIPVLAAIVHASLMIGRPKSVGNLSLCRIEDSPQNDLFAAFVRASSVRSSMSVREICLHRLGITLECLQAEIKPRVAECVAQCIIDVPEIRPIDIPWRLRDLARNWSGNDDGFARSLHHALLTTLAKRACRWSAPWSTLSDGSRMALRTQVLGLAPDDQELSSLDEQSLFRLWGLYFEIADPAKDKLYPGSEMMLDALRWPLRAALWRVAAEVHADPRRARKGQVNGRFHALSAKCVDDVCTEALEEGKPQFALPALQAILMWQVTRACRTVWERAEHGGTAEDRGLAESDAQCPVFSPAAWAIFEHCTLAERLPFIAALFRCRDVIIECDLEWHYETLVAEDVIAFLCDPTSSLCCPSNVVIDALHHYLPSCAALLPERLAAPDNWEATFLSRFDLPPLAMKPLRLLREKRDVRQGA